MEPPPEDVSWEVAATELVVEHLGPDLGSLAWSAISDNRVGIVEKGVP